jgi:hypothetical protein
MGGRIERSSSTSASGGSGIGFFGMLTILFIGLKLAGLIAWPWVYVLLPMWLPLAILLAIFVVAFAAFTPPR